MYLKIWISLSLFITFVLIFQFIIYESIECLLIGTMYLKYSLCLNLIVSNVNDMNKINIKKV